MARPEGRLQAEKMARVLRYQLRDSGAGLALKWVAPGATDLPSAARQIARTERPLMVVWEGALGKNQIHIYYPRPGDSSGRIRTVAKAAESRTGRIEVAGLIVRNSVEAILSNRAASPPRPRTVPPVVIRRRAPPRAPPAPRRSVAAAVALQYGLSAYSPDTDQAVAHTGALELQLTFKRHWSVYLGYGVTPLVSRQDEAVLKQQRHGLAVGGAYTWRWGRTAISARLAVETDIVRSELTVDNANFDSKPPALDVNLGVSASIRLSIALTRRLDVYTGIGAVFVLLNSDYSAESLLLSQPWVVRPLCHIGVSARFY